MFTVSNSINTFIRPVVQLFVQGSLTFIDLMIMLQPCSKILISLEIEEAEMIFLDTEIKEIKILDIEIPDIEIPDIDILDIESLGFGGLDLETRDIEILDIKSQGNKRVDIERLGIEIMHIEVLDGCGVSYSRVGAPEEVESVLRTIRRRGRGRKTKMVLRDPIPKKCFRSTQFGHTTGGERNGSAGGSSETCFPARDARAVGVVEVFNTGRLN